MNMVKKEAKLLELGRGSFIDRQVRMCQRERHGGGKLFAAVFTMGGGQDM